MTYPTTKVSEATAPTATLQFSTAPVITPMPPTTRRTSTTTLKVSAISPTSFVSLPTVAHRHARLPSPQWLTGLDIVILVTIFIVSVGFSVCCCRRCFGLISRRFDDDDAEKRPKIIANLPLPQTEIGSSFELRYK